MKHGHGNQFPRQAAGGRPRETAHGPAARQRPDQDENEIAQILKSPNRIELWSGNDRTIFRPELLDSEAQERAKALREVASSQLRRFYGLTVAFKQRLEIDKNVTDSEVEAQIAYLKASSAYAGARKQPKALIEFFVAAANSVKKRDDYICFARHFEAVMAFHKVFGTKEG